MELQEMTDEELVLMIRNNENVNEAYLQLLQNLKPFFKKIAKGYLYAVPLYDLDDFLQEGFIVIWKAVISEKVDLKHFRASCVKMYKYSCLRVYRDYQLRNPILLDVGCDLYDESIRHCVLVESEYVKKYREKQRKYNKERYERNREILGIKPRTKLTEEERRQKRNAYARKYHKEHRELCIERRRNWYIKNREYALKYQKEYDSTHKRKKKDKID